MAPMNLREHHRTLYFLFAVNGLSFHYLRNPVHVRLRLFSLSLWCSKRNLLIQLQWCTTDKWLGISVQFSRSVVSDSLWPHESQHARPPCPLPIPRVHPNPCPSSQWCHPAISSSVVPSSSRLGSFNFHQVVRELWRWYKAGESRPSRYNPKVMMLMINLDINCQSVSFT